MPNVEILKIIVEAGVSFFSIALLAGLIVWRDKRHEQERDRTWEHQHQQSEKVTASLDRLSDELRNIHRNILNERQKYD